SQFRPDRAVAPILALKSTKPVAVFLTPHAERSRQLLREAGVAVFSQPEACADALSAWVRWQAPRPADIPQATSSQLPLPETLSSGRTLSAADSQQVLASLGIPQVQEWML